MNKQDIAQWVSDNFVPEIVCPKTQEKFKGFDIIVNMVEPLRFSDPEKCKKFGTACDEVVGGFISGSNGQLGDKFLYRKVEVEPKTEGKSFQQRVKITSLPEETDDGIEVAKISYTRHPTARLNRILAEAGLAQKKSEEVFLFARLFPTEVEVKTVVKSFCLGTI